MGNNSFSTPVLICVADKYNALFELVCRFLAVIAISFKKKHVKPLYDRHATLGAVFNVERII